VKTNALQQILLLNIKKKERNFEDLRLTDYSTNSKGGATDLKVGGQNICERSGQKNFRLTPHFWHTQIKQNTA